MNVLDRKQNETDFAYKYRLIMGKKNQLESYSSLEWEDIKEIIGSEEHRDTLRKRGDAWKELLDHANEVNLKDSDDELLLEIKKERNKLNDLRNLVNKEVRKLSKIEDFVEIIINECKNIDSFILPDTQDKPIINEFGTDAILDISDVHYDGSEIVNKNLYKLISESIDICKLHNVNMLTVFINGDIVNGELKKTISRENREAIGKQLVGVSELLSDAMLKLSKNIPYVCVGINSGNHDRSIENYNDALTTDNYLPVIKEMIKLRISNVGNIVMIDNYIDDRFTLCKIKNKTHVSYHGNGLKNIEKDSIRTVEGFLDLKVDYLHLGHFHSPKELTNYDSKIIINGSLYNRSNYGKKLLLRSNEIQKLMILDKVGDIKCTYDIKLS